MLPLLFKGECQAKCFFTKLLYIILFHPIFGFSLNPFDHYCQLPFLFSHLFFTESHSSIITFFITPDRETITRLALIKACYERPPCFSASPSFSSISLLFFLTRSIITVLAHHHPLLIVTLTHVWP